MKKILTICSVMLLCTTQLFAGFFTKGWEQENYVDKDGKPVEDLYGIIKIDDAKLIETGGNRQTVKAAVLFEVKEKEPTAYFMPFFHESGWDSPVASIYDGGTWSFKNALNGTYTLTTEWEHWNLLDQQCAQFILESLLETDYVLCVFSNEDVRYSFKLTNKNFEDLFTKIYESRKHGWKARNEWSHFEINLPESNIFIRQATILVDQNNPFISKVVINSFEPNRFPTFSIYHYIDSHGLLFETKDLEITDSQMTCGNETTKLDVGGLPYLISIYQNYHDSKTWKLIDTDLFNICKKGKTLTITSKYNYNKEFSISLKTSDVLQYMNYCYWRI